jgi:hypothetical protein
MARYVAWLGQLGTIKATSLQPYLSAVNGFLKDHGLKYQNSLQQEKTVKATSKQKG